MFNARTGNHQVGLLHKLGDTIYHRHHTVSTLQFQFHYPLLGLLAYSSHKVKLLFGPLVIQLVWYILKQLFTSVSVKVVAW